MTPAAPIHGTRGGRSKAMERLVMDITRLTERNRMSPSLWMAIGCALGGFLSISVGMWYRLGGPYGTANVFLGAGCGLGVGAILLTARVVYMKRKAGAGRTATEEDE